VSFAAVVVPRFGHHVHAGLKRQGSGDALRGAVGAAHHEGVRRFGFDAGLLRSLHANGEGKASRLVRGETDHDNLIHRTGKDFANEADAAAGELDAAMAVSRFSSRR
jgi:hypothetical protein